MVLGAARRIAFMVLVLAAASLASFVFFWKTDQQLQHRSALHGYRQWLDGLRSGRSFEGLWTQQKLWPVFETALEHTGVLVGLALLVTIPACIGIACLAAWRRDGVLDTLFRTLAYAVWAVPPFLLALLITLAATSWGNRGQLGPFGAGGWPDTCVPGFDYSTGQDVVCPPPPSLLSHTVHVLQALAIPALALAAGFIGIHARHLRGALLHTLDAPFIVTARSKGLTERRIVVRHAMKISLATFLSGLLADVGAIFGAALAVDAIFQLGGLGTLLLDLFPRVEGYVPIDIYAVQLMLLITGLFVLVSALLADGAVALLDPRLRRGRP